MLILLLVYTFRGNWCKWRIPCGTGLRWKPVLYECCLHCECDGFGVTAVLYSPFISLWRHDFSFPMACEVCLFVIEWDLSINFQIKAPMRTLLEYKSLNHHIRESIWILWVLVLSVNKKLDWCCKIRSILSPQFIQSLHNHYLQIRLLLLFLSHWREKQSKVTSVTVHAINILFVKDHCQEKSELGPKLEGSSCSWR